MKKEKYFFNIRWIAWVEIICFFALCYFIAEAAHIPINFFSYSPHPFWIIVLLITVQYGTSAGLLAASIATFIYFIGPLPKQNMMQENSDYFFLLAKLPLLWFVTALILGELRMKQIRERDTLRAIVDKTQEREKEIAESYESLKKIKEHLEKHVASAAPTVVNILTAFQALDECKKEEIFDKTSELIRTTLAPEKFSLYLLKNKQLVLEKSEGWQPEDQFLTTFDPSIKLYQEVVDNKRTVSIATNNGESLGKEGLVAAPILASSSGKVIGMIKIEMMPFQLLKLGTSQQLAMIGLAIGKAYAR